MRKFGKRMVCKHRWKRLWFRAGHYDVCADESGRRSYPIEKWYCICEKRGKEGYVTFELDRGRWVVPGRIFRWRREEVIEDGL